MDKFEELLAVCREHNQTISFAESCTGGLLAANMVRFSGVSAYFLGSIVAYANDVKTGVLGVDSELIQDHGAVSQEVAQMMAKRAREKMQSNWAVAISGIAGPGGGSDEKPVGTVCFGLSGPELETSWKTRFDGDRRQVQDASAEMAASRLITAIRDRAK